MLRVLGGGPWIFRVVDPTTPIRRWRGRPRPACPAPPPGAPGRKRRGPGSDASIPQSTPNPSVASVITRRGRPVKVDRGRPYCSASASRSAALSRRRPERAHAARRCALPSAPPAPRRRPLPFPGLTPASSVAVVPGGEDVRQHGESFSCSVPAGSLRQVEVRPRHAQVLGLAAPVRAHHRYP